MIFDCIVIGKGLIGSAAARYLSLSLKAVAIVGPDEHPDLKKAIVFSSHYDQARVQRIIGADPVWTLLNLQSSRQYDFLEKESKISFHSKVGCLYVNPEGTDQYLEQTENQANQFGLNMIFLKKEKRYKRLFLISTACLIKRHIRRCSGGLYKSTFIDKSTIKLISKK